MNKKTLGRIAYCKGALEELLAGASGAKPFYWGETEGQSKMAWLARAGFVLVSKTKLEKGGHQLKKGAKPVGRVYYGAPLKVKADLYLLGVQTVRHPKKWFDLYDKGKALCEDGSYAKTPLMISIEDCAKKVKAASEPEVQES